MKSFLLKDKTPTVKWSLVPDGIYFEGKIPEGYSLGICPNAPYIVLDIDKHGNVNGFDNIPSELVDDLQNYHFHYSTKNHGRHVWLKYTGHKELANKTSGVGIDLRTHKGYVRFYLEGDMRNYIHSVKETSPELNKWLESLFSYNDEVVKKTNKNGN